MMWVAQAVQKGMGPADGGAIGDLGRRYDPNDPVVRKAIEITLRQGEVFDGVAADLAGEGSWVCVGVGDLAGGDWGDWASKGHKPRDVDFFYDG